MNLSEAMTKYNLPAKDIFKKIKSGELKGVSPNNKTNTTHKWSIEEAVQAQLAPKPEIPATPVIADIKPEIQPSVNPVITDKKEVKEVIKNDTEKTSRPVVKKGKKTKEHIRISPDSNFHIPETGSNDNAESGSFFWW